MEEVIVKVYKFSELSEESKKKAIEDYRSYIEDNLDNSIMSDCMKEMVKEFMDDEKISHDDFEMEYSLNHSQGDGARLIGVFGYKGHRFKVVSKPDCIGSHYVHSNSVSHECIDDYNLTDKEYDRMMDEWIEVYKMVCGKLEEYGYDWIEEERSDSHISEELEINEYRFTADGKRFHL